MAEGANLQSVQHRSGNSHARGETLVYDVSHQSLSWKMRKTQRPRRGYGHGVSPDAEGDMTRGVAYSFPVKKPDLMSWHLQP